MIEYVSTAQFESKLVPGVSYKLNKMSHQRRMKLNHDAAGVFAEINEIQRQADVIQEEIDKAEKAAKIEPCTCNHLPEPGRDCHDSKTGRCTVPNPAYEAAEDKKGIEEFIPNRRCPCRQPKPDPEIGTYETRDRLLDKVYEVIIEKLYPIYVSWGVKDVQGLKINGLDADTTALLTDGPEFLVSEVGSEIQRLMKLSPDEVMAFKSPTISGAQTDGETTSTHAPIAS